MWAKQNKYHAKRVNYDGMEFDSKKEFNRYMELKMLQRAGRIGSIERQVRFELIPSQKDENGKVIERPAFYVADFVYIDRESGKVVVEDVKGTKETQAYALFSLKRKLMLFRHGIRVKEV